MINVKTVKENRSFTESDNKGTRYNSAEEWSDYLTAMKVFGLHEPSLIYIFDNATDARNALMGLDFIKEATDTHNLISTEIITFGYHGVENGKYLVRLRGCFLKYKIYQAAKATFTEHGGGFFFGIVFTHVGESRGE